MHAVRTTHPPGGALRAVAVAAAMASMLAAAGCGLEDVIKVNAFLTDLGNFAVYNAVYREYFKEPYPARTTVGAALAPGLHVEVEVIARRPN